MTANQLQGMARTRIDDQGRTLLHFAAGDARPERVAELLALGADANAPDDNGWTALHFAAQARSQECVALLLRAGADPSLQDSDGNTALWRAVYWSGGEGAVIRLLREAGADPFTENKHGVSPISLARSIDNHDVAQFFSDLPSSTGAA